MLERMVDWIKSLVTCAAVMFLALALSFAIFVTAVEIGAVKLP